MLRAGGCATRPRRTSRDGREGVSERVLAQALSYLKATRLRLALVINFNVPVLLQGVRRVVFCAPPSL